MKRFAYLLLFPACTVNPDESIATSATRTVPLDLDGTPDLYVREDILSKKWIVRDVDIADGSCEQIEGNITPGTHRVVKFAVGVANIGDADLLIGDPNEAINQGLFEFAACHHHYHFRNYAT